MTIFDEISEQLGSISEVVASAIENEQPLLVNWGGVAVSLVTIAETIQDIQFGDLEENDVYDDDVPSIRE